MINQFRSQPRLLRYVSSGTDGDDNCQLSAVGMEASEKLTELL
jgi:hypothetical protein